MHGICHLSDAVFAKKVHHGTNSIKDSILVEDLVPLAFQIVSLETVLDFISNYYLNFYILFNIY